MKWLLFVVVCVIQGISWSSPASADYSSDFQETIVQNDWLDDFSNADLEKLEEDQKEIWELDFAPRDFENFAKRINFTWNHIYFYVVPYLHFTPPDNLI